MSLNNRELPDTTKHTPVKVFCDAAYDQGVSHATAGIVVKNHAGRTIYAGGEDLGRITDNNEAEQQAICRVIKMLKYKVNHVKIYSDSTNAIRSIKTRNDLSSQPFDLLTLEHVPRDHNQEADLAAESIMNRKRLRGV